MNIVFICTNYSSLEDGIGHYTYNLMQKMEENENVNTEIITGRTTNFNRLEKIKSKAMIKSIDDFIKLKSQFINDKTYFIIEYPFLEWNPNIIFSLIKLKKICKERNSKLILSLHEYKRVKILRRYLINLLIIISDAVMLTDKETEKIIRKYNKPTLLRPIPSNIPKTNELEKCEDLYCYFGLINKSKSFNEMIDAWKLFNQKGKYRLNIYTSTEIEIKESEKFNINYYKGIDDLNLSKKLWECKYAILPINPYIDMNNATLKAIAEHKCIPIGKFASKELENLGIGVDAKAYTVENLLEAYTKSLKLDRKEYNIKLEQLNDFGERFSFRKNVELIVDFLRSL